MTHSLHEQTTVLPIRDGCTYGFLLTGLGALTAEFQFQHGTEWFPYPDIDYTAQSGVVHGRVAVVSSRLRIHLSAPATSPNIPLLTWTETITSPR